MATFLRISLRAVHRFPHLSQYSSVNGKAYLHLCLFEAFDNPAMFRCFPRLGMSRAGRNKRLRPADRQVEVHDSKNNGLWQLTYNTRLPFWDYTFENCLFPRTIQLSHLTVRIQNSKGLTPKMVYDRQKKAISSARKDHVHCSSNTQRFCALCSLEDNFTSLHWWFDRGQSQLTLASFNKLLEHTNKTLFPISHQNDDFVYLKDMRTMFFVRITLTLPDNQDHPHVKSRHYRRPTSKQKRRRNVKERPSLVLKTFKLKQSIDTISPF